MKVLLLKKSFRLYNDLKLLALAQNVLSRINREEIQNHEFDSIFVPNLSPPRSDVIELTSAFADAIMAYMNKGKAEKVIRDIRRLELENALKLWALQIEVFANGDLEILINSGFDINKQPAPIPHPGVPVDFTVTSTNIGELTLTAKKVKGVIAFQFELNILDDPNIIICTQGNSKCVVRNLKSGVYYVCKAAYISRNEHKVYSDSKTIVVQ